VRQLNNRVGKNTISKQLLRKIKIQTTRYLCHYSAFSQSERPFWHMQCFVIGRPWAATKGLLMTSAYHQFPQCARSIRHWVYWRGNGAGYLGVLGYWCRA